MNHKVIFYEVKNSQDKIRVLLRLAQKHFESKHKLFFFSENVEGTNYLDLLLWKEPKTSFLPHGVDDLSAPLVVVASEKLLASALFIFNLTQNPLMLSEPFRTIFEFDDQSSDQKSTISKQKYHQYLNQQYRIEEIK